MPTRPGGNITIYIFSGLTQQIIFILSVDANWNNWSKCNRQCGSGIRRRTCDNDLGTNCPNGGDGGDEETCNTHPCPGKAKKKFGFFFRNIGKNFIA